MYRQKQQHIKLHEPEHHMVFFGGVQSSPDLTKLQDVLRETNCRPIEDLISHFLNRESSATCDGGNS